MLRAVRRLFREFVHFHQMDPDSRRKIAGLVMEGDTNFLWFGSMRGAGYFKQAIKDNNGHLSHALDSIPLSGPVDRSQYLRYVDQFVEAIPNGGAGIATATRLLAMKRPDTFVCLDSRNKERLCDAFGVSRNIDYEAYWDSIVGRIMDAAWWCALPPESGVELEVWEARAAFLDSLFYDGKDMPKS